MGFEGRLQGQQAGLVHVDMSGPTSDCCAHAESQSASTALCGPHTAAPGQGHGKLGPGALAASQALAVPTG